MRKYILIFAMVSFAVTSCGNTAGDADSAKSAKEPVIANKEKTGDAKKGETIHLTKADFLEKIMDYESNPSEWNYKGNKPAIIDFYADWCGPCKIAGPILEEIAEEYKGEIIVYKVDTEQERELSSVFGISSIPAFLFIPEEGKPTMSNGIARTPEQTKEMFVKMIDELLLGKETTEEM